MLLNLDRGVAQIEPIDKNAAQVAAQRSKTQPCRIQNSIVLGAMLGITLTSSLLLLACLKSLKTELLQDALLLLGALKLLQELLLLLGVLISRLGRAVAASLGSARLGLLALQFPATSSNSLLIIFRQESIKLLSSNNKRALASNVTSQYLGQLIIRYCS